MRRVFVKHVLKRRGKKGFVQACNAYFPIHTSTAERPFPPQQIHNFPLRGRGTMPCAPLGRTGLLAALEDLTVTFSFPNARQIHFLSVGQSKHGWPATVTTQSNPCAPSQVVLFFRIDLFSVRSRKLHGGKIYINVCKIISLSSQEYSASSHASSLSGRHSQLSQLASQLAS